jgi:hypothetical protein
VKRCDDGMVTAGHEDGVAVAYHRHQLRIFGIVVNTLDAKSRIGHVEIDVNLFQHVGVLVGRPTGPVARFRVGETSDQPSCLHVLGKEHVEMAPGTGAASVEFQTGIMFDFRIANHLQRITPSDVSGKLNQVDVRVGCNRDRRIPRDINRVEPAEGDFFAVHDNHGLSQEAN